MLRYRALLVDTEGSYTRPVQAFFNTALQVDEWAKAVLKNAVGKDAFVVLYRTTEVEIGTIKRSDYDQGAAARIQPSGQEAGKSA